MAYVDTATQPSDWWDRLKIAGPGLFDLGTGIYSRSAGIGEAADRLKQAQGPLYDASMAGAQNSLAQAGNLNPQDFAANRYAANRALVAPVQSKNLDDLMRSLYAKGLLGAATYNPGVPGITPNGTAMSPQLAAFFAAQNADNSQTAYNSLTEGQNYLDALLKRSGLLSQQAGQVQNTGLRAQSTQPSRAASNYETFKGIGSILKDTGLLGKGVDMIKDWWGGGSDPWKMSDFTSGPSGSELGWWG